MKTEDTVRTLKAEILVLLKPPSQQERGQERGDRTLVCAHVSAPGGSLSSQCEKRVKESSRLPSARRKRRKGNFLLKPLQQARFSFRSKSRDNAVRSGLAGAPEP